MLTNRHVVEPWREDEEIAAILSLGVRPHVVQLRAFFPDVSDPVPVTVLRTSEDADVALVKGDVKSGSLPVPSLDQTGQEVVPGRPVLLLGYPASVDGSSRCSREPTAQTT